MTLGIALSSHPLGVSAAEVNKAHTTAAVPFHIPTRAYDDGCSGGAGVRASVVRRVAQLRRGQLRSPSHQGPQRWSRKSRRLLQGHAVSGHGLEITRTVRCRRGPQIAAIWWLHNPGPHQRQPVYSPYLGGGHLINQRKSDTRRFFQSYVRGRSSSCSTACSEARPAESEFVDEVFIFLPWLLQNRADPPSMPTCAAVIRR